MARTLFSILLCVLPILLTRVNAFANYTNDFVNPDYVVAGKFGAHTRAAQNTIVTLAKRTAREGPWSVMDKPFTAPSKNKHDYLSWAPFWWPDCTGAGNKTELTPEQIWTTCKYVRRDGHINPDTRTVNDTGHFKALADAVLYNTMAWRITGSTSYAQTAVNFIRIWFLDSATRMNPNVNYGQLQRGANQTGLGTQFGLLEVRSMTKIASGILILRKGGSKAWTADLDGRMNAWARDYIRWLETKDIAILASQATNNHGTFFFNQLAAFKILIGDFAGARAVTNRYFNGLFMNQIKRNGEQPLETSRAQPFHYSAENLAAMITNGRLAQYAGAGPSIWQKRSSEGATIKTALDYAMTLSPNELESAFITDLHPNIAAVASIYGDPIKKYQTFLMSEDPLFASQAYFFWDQPFGVGLSTRDLVSSGGSNISAMHKRTTRRRAARGARLS